MVSLLWSCLLREKAEVRRAPVYEKATVLLGWGWGVGWRWSYDRSLTTPPGSHEVISAFPGKSETEPLSRQADRQLSLPHSLPELIRGGRHCQALNTVLRLWGSGSTQSQPSCAELSLSHSKPQQNVHYIYEYQKAWVPGLSAWLKTAN